MKSPSPSPAIRQQYPTKIAIVDDDENDCLLMILALKKSGAFVLAGVYRSAEEALVGIPNIRPHLALMDIRLPGVDGHECARRLRIIVPPLKIVFVTGLLDVDTMYKSLRTGADGYLTKPTGAAQLLAVLLKAVDSKPATENASAISSREIDTSTACSFLTVRENQIMALLAEGLLDKEIAAKLGISYSTVHFHLHNIFIKSACQNRVEALVRWRDANRP